MDSKLRKQVLQIIIRNLTSIAADWDELVAEVAPHGVTADQLRRILRSTKAKGQRVFLYNPALRRWFYVPDLLYLASSGVYTRAGVLVTLNEIQSHAHKQVASSKKRMSELQALIDNIKSGATFQKPSLPDEGNA